jgi:CRP/FNR family cyclic AMP-dependent transcriptional regulator
MAQESQQTPVNRTASKESTMSDRHSQSVPGSSDIVLAWNAAIAAEPLGPSPSEFGQQSEYGGQLFDELIGETEELNQDCERYAQMIPGERLEPTEEYLRAYIKLSNLRKFEPQSTIIFGGERCDSIFLLLRGMVSVHIDGVADREIIVDYLATGEFFGELPMFLDSRQRSAAIKAKFACEVAELSYTRFRALSQQHPDLIFAVAKQMANRLVRTTQKVSDLAFLDVTGRVARTLMELSKQPNAVTHPQGMQIKVTRQELGNIVGCSREMAGRVIRSLSTEGLISVRGKTMVVHGTR